jgi:hypothetical protein
MEYLGIAQIMRRFLFLRTILQSRLVKFAPALRELLELLELLPAAG